MLCRWRPQDTYDIPLVNINVRSEEDEAILLAQDKGIGDVTALNQADDVLWVRTDLGPGLRIDPADLNVT